MSCRTLGFQAFTRCIAAAAYIARATWAQEAGPAPPGPRRLTLQDAQARAAANGRAAELPKLNVRAAKYHRQAAQADYFPKIGSILYNLHYNKFMGIEVQVVGRTAQLPLLNKDETVFALTATQPITPIFQVREAVRIARADERIAQAQANAAVAH